MKKQDKKSLVEIAFRANVNLKKITNNHVAIYEDHRTIINVLFNLIQIRDLGQSVDLISFDYHEDYCTPSEQAIESIKKFLDNPNEQELNRIVEFELHSLDDDWIKVGMQLGLINNVFLFNAETNNEGKIDSYETLFNGTKALFNIGNVWDALGYHGRLNDPIKESHEKLCQAFGWHLIDGSYSFPNNRRPFVLDFDLDFLSTQILNRTTSYPREIIMDKFQERLSANYHHYYNCTEFVKDLIDRSELVTICFEQGCCGGIYNSFQNLSLIDELFFNNVILNA